MNLAELDQKIEALREEYKNATTERDRRNLAARGRALKNAREIKQAREGML